MLEIHGQRCKKFSLSQNSSPKKKSIQLSLFLERDKASCIIEKTRSKTSQKNSLYSSSICSNKRQDIVLSSDLPSVPFYMPKMMSRTPSPTRATRTRGKNIRLNLYSPFQLPINQAIEISGKRFNGKMNAIDKSFDFSNIKQRKDLNLAYTKFRLNDLNLQLPKIINLTANHKKRLEST